ncbi:MAG: hypothetical protein AAEJ04_10015, partial [Planctomycetota bacterium]
MNTINNPPAPRKRNRPQRSRAAESIHRRLSGLVRSLLSKKGNDSLSGLPEQVELNLRIPIHLDGSGLFESREFARTLLAQVESLRIQGETESLGLRSGHAPCYWCNAVACQHSQPPDHSSVLHSWSQTGIPIWKNLTTLLLETKDEQIDLIYGETPRPVIVWRSEPELLQETLPEFLGDSLFARPIGALVAGGFPLPSPDGEPNLLSVTALVQESRSGRNIPKYTLNLIATTPPPHHLASLVGSDMSTALTNWTRALRSSFNSLQQRLTSMAEKGNRASIQKSRQEVVEILIESRSYLITMRRRSERRTLHAEERSSDPD